MLPLLTLWIAPPPPVVPLPRAHAHNDYAHTRPLHDALAHGFTSVEADVFLSNGHLLVGHTWLEVLPDRLRDQPQRTLQTLYLEPLRQRIKQRGGAVYDDKTPFYLLIDLKTEARATYAAVHEALAQYPDVFSVTRDGKHRPGPVVAVISGNTPREMIRAQKVRYAGIDGRPSDLDSDDPPQLMPWISTAWRFRWRGEGAMPAAERDKLRDLVRKAHAKGRQVRFWATPENEAVWQELYDAGVDRLNTDRLSPMRDWLRSR